MSFFVVQLYADYEEYKVFIQQIGFRSCGFNGFRTSKDVKFTASHDDCLEMLYGKHVYQIEFNPPPVKTPFLSKKRSRDSEMSNENEESSHKIVKTKDNNKDEKSEEEEPQTEVKRKQNDQGILKYIKKSKTTSNEFKDEDNMIDLDNEQVTWESKASGAVLICTTQGVESRSKVN